MTDMMAEPRISTEEMLARFMQNEQEVTAHETGASNDFGFGAEATRKMQLAQQAGEGMVKGVDGSIGDAIYGGVDQNEEERRQKVVQRFVTMSVVDQMIKKIDLRLNEIDTEINHFRQDNLQIGIERERLTLEESEVRDELERHETTKAEAEARTPEVEQAVIDAEQANTEALLEQERAQRALISANGPDDVIRCTHAIEAATEKVELTTEELALRRQQALEHVTNLEELDQGILALEARLTEIETELGELDAREVSNNASIKALELEQSELRSAKDTLQNDEGFRAKVESGEYTVQEVISELPPAAQDTFTQQLDGWINTATDAAWSAWSGVKDVANNALEAASDTVNSALEGANNAISTVADGASTAVNAASDLVNGAINTATNIVSSEPTGDRVGTTAANEDGQGITATPPSTQNAFTAAVTPGLGHHPAAAPVHTPAPAPSMHG